MRYCFIVLLIAAAFVKVAAQPANKPKFSTRDLSIVWEPVQNNYQNPQQSLNAITITNNGKATFPAIGRGMYFNSARLIAPQTVTGNAKITFVNGDLFSLTPTSTFTGLNPKESVRIEFIGEEPVVNITDGPEGFYIVWYDEPGKGYNTGALTIKPFKPNYAGLITPTIIYDQNKIVQDIPDQQLKKVFPTPTSYRLADGVFTVDKNVIVGAAPTERFATETNLLKEYLESLTGEKFLTKPGSGR